MQYLIITFIFSFLFQPQERKIQGKYKIIYDYSYCSYNGTINCDYSTYTRKQ
jgi:hypothetical protein